jgi:hypothetical protein
MSVLRIALLLALALPLAAQEVVVFWEPGFPALETQAPPREAIAGTLSPRFAGIDELNRPGALAGAALLVLPYGSAFPADAWRAIEQYLNDGGNLLNIGGRPLTAPVWREAAGFRAGRPQSTWSRRLGIGHTFEAPQREFRSFAWEDDFGFLPRLAVRARRAFVVNAEGRGAYRGVGYLLDGRGWRAAAAVTRSDFLDRGGRSVFLNFEAEPGYWASTDGAQLLRTAAAHARQGATRMWVETRNASLLPGEPPQIVVHLQRSVRPPLAGRVALELLSGTAVRARKEIAAAGESIRELVMFSEQLAPGFYTVRASYAGAGGVEESYHSGFWVRDEKLLTGAPRLTVAGDYFQLGGKPALLWGMNYFSTDVMNTGFFVGGSEAGNGYVWQRDFAEMAARGVNFIRTGTWHNHTFYLDRVTGAPDERFLRALEAFVLSAAASGIEVQYTFFSFDPQTIQRRGQTSLVTHPGSNPYTDPVSIAAQKRFLQPIVERFKSVPHLSWDLINEPSFSNPAQIFRGNIPNADPTEQAAWNRWLERRYGTMEKLAEAWRTSAAELGGFGLLPLPDPGQLNYSRAGNPALVRAVDYNLFAQETFAGWARELVAAIRATGSKQLVTVGQDEGGVTNRPLNHFYADGGVDFTVNHSWWRDDALLWDSFAAKRPDMPNLIGETGPQPAWRMDGGVRWDEPNALSLFERKMALGFAAGNAGSLHWDWSRSDTFSILRRDGSYKSWMDSFAGMGEFVKRASPHARGARRAEAAVVLPQSLQLSAFNSLALEGQQRAVRALFHYARTTGYAVGEYQLRLLGDPKLIIVPSPWVFRADAWQTLVERVRAGATLLWTGPLDTDEHFHHTGRAKALGLEYEAALLTTRENPLRWPGGEAVFRYAGDRTTALEQGRLAGGATFVELPLGKGRLLYFPLPLELSDNEEATGRVYRWALERVGVQPLYTTKVTDPGVLIAPTPLEGGTLYVLTSESSVAQDVAFRDAASGKDLSVRLRPGRAALLLVLRSGEVAARFEGGS